MKSLLVLTLLMIVVHQKKGFAQLQIVSNSPNTFLIPPSMEAPRNFNNNGVQNKKYTRIRFARNWNDDNYYFNQQEHQTDWIPMVPPPTAAMDNKHDKVFDTNFPDQIAASSRRGKILTGNGEVNLSNYVQFKTNDNQMKQRNESSFVYFKKLLSSKANKQTNDDKNKSFDLTNSKDKTEVLNIVHHELLGKMIQAKLDNLLKKFEGNLSKILDDAILNATSDANKNRVQRENTASTDIYRSNEVPTQFLQPVGQFNDPPTSGTSSPRLISSSYWAGPLAEAGYTSPPNLNLDSNGGTLDYTIEHRGTQEMYGTSDSTTHRSIQIQPQNININRNYYPNNQGNKSPIEIGIKDYKSEVGDTGKLNDQTAEFNREFNQFNYTTDRNVSIEGNENINNKTFEQELKRKSVELNEPFERNINIDEDGRVEETIVRDNRVSKRMYPFYTSVDLKGIDTFHSGHNNNDFIDNLKGVNLHALDKFRNEQKINLGYNSLDHLPPDPLVSLFLSHYGRYIPRGHVLSSNFKNIYSYLASNNIHNNKPFGSYKIYEDTEG